MAQQVSAAFQCALASVLIRSRLEGCQRDVEVWQRILQLRSLVLTPSEDMDTWISFADLCRTSDRLNLAEKTLRSLVGSSYIASDPEVCGVSTGASTRMRRVRVMPKLTPL
jgi:phosphatidylinositol kinase/protein kinase (PI-3  family)